MPSCVLLKIKFPCKENKKSELFFICQYETGTDKNITHKPGVATISWWVDGDPIWKNRYKLECRQVDMQQIMYLCNPTIKIKANLTDGKRKKKTNEKGVYSKGLYWNEERWNLHFENIFDRYVTNEYLFRSRPES